jgi:hypothetical protein
VTVDICIAKYSISNSCHLPTILLEFPVPVVQGADLTSLQPTGYAVEMECVVANSPCNCTLLVCGRALICLTLDAQIHDMVTANSTVVDNNIPCPQSNRVPLLDLESLLSIVGTLGLGGSLALDRGLCGSFLHLDIRHFAVVISVDIKIGRTGKAEGSIDAGCVTKLFRVMLDAEFKAVGAGGSKAYTQGTYVLLLKRQEPLCLSC